MHETDRSSRVLLFRTSDPAMARGCGLSHQQIRYPGDNRLILPPAIDGMVWHTSVSSHPGAGVGPKGVGLITAH